MHPLSLLIGLAAGSGLTLAAGSGLTLAAGFAFVRWVGRVADALDEDRAVDLCGWVSVDPDDFDPRRAAAHSDPVRAGAEEAGKKHRQRNGTGRAA